MGVGVGMQLHPQQGGLSMNSTPNSTGTIPFHAFGGGNMMGQQASHGSQGFPYLQQAAFQQTYIQGGTFAPFQAGITYSQLAGSTDTGDVGQQQQVHQQQSPLQQQMIGMVSNAPPHRQMAVSGYFQAGLGEMDQHLAQAVGHAPTMIHPQPMRGFPMGAYGGIHDHHSFGFGIHPGYVGLASLGGKSKEDQQQEERLEKRRRQNRESQQRFRERRKREKEALFEAGDHPSAPETSHKKLKVGTAKDKASKN